MKPSHLIFPLAAFLFAPIPTARALPASPPPCKPYQLSFNTDNESGAFNGMSHSGTLLVLRNLGPNACTVAARPLVVFQDASHHTLPTTLQLPRGMHPGPVILPVVIPTGAELTSRMRWVSSDAYDAHNGIAPAYITLHIAGHTFTRKFSGQLFGAAGKHPSYTATLFRRDPPWPPPAKTKAPPSKHLSCSRPAPAVTAPS